MFQIVLKELREQYQLSQAELAQKLNISQSTVGMWESGRNKPDYATLLTLSSLFHVSLDFLMTGKLESSSFLKVPIYPYLPLSEGTAEDLTKIVNYQLLDKKEHSVGAYLGFLAADDNMSPLILKGDTIILNVRDHWEPHNGDVLVFQSEKLFSGAVSMRFFKKVPNGVILYTSSNQNTPDFFSHPEWYSINFTFMSKVIEIRRAF